MARNAIARTDGSGRHLALVQQDARIMSQTHKPRALNHPKTLPQRLAARRIELGLSHGDIAKHIYVTRYVGTTKEQKVQIARNTYCNYERGTVPPKTEVLEQVAVVLKVPVEWLMFGDNKTTTIKKVEWDRTTNAFDETQDWSIDSDFLKARFGQDAHQLIVSPVVQDTPSCQEGDMALCRRDVKPGPDSGEFIFASKGRVHAAKIIRPVTSALLRIYGPTGMDYTEVPQSRVVILGRIVGKVGGLLN